MPFWLAACLPACLVMYYVAGIRVLDLDLGSMTEGQLKAEFVAFTPILEIQ